MQYKIKVTIDTIKLFDNGVFEKEFHVFVPLDLNEMPQTQLPVRTEKSQQFNSIFNPSKPYRLTFELPYSGFCNEKKIPFSLEYFNSSNIHIKGVNVSLHKLLTYHAEKPFVETKLKDIKLSELKFPFSIKKQQTKQFTDELLVPAATALNLANCSIIQVRHCIRITTIAGAFRHNGVFDVPVTIAHIGQRSGTPIQMPSNEEVVQEPPSFETAMQSSASVVPENN